MSTGPLMDLDCHPTSGRAAPLPTSIKSEVLRAKNPDNFPQVAKKSSRNFCG